VKRHVCEQFVHLASVVANLVDDEAGACRNLLRQFEILRHDLTLQPLVIGHDGAGEERADGCLGEDLQQAHRIGVEHGRRPTVVPGDRVISG